MEGTLGLQLASQNCTELIIIVVDTCDKTQWKIDLDKQKKRKKILLLKKWARLKREYYHRRGEKQYYYPQLHLSLNNFDHESELF